MNTQLPPRYSQSFPAALRAARRARGLTSSEFAEIIGTRKAYVPRWEDPNHSNHGAPKLSTYLAIQEYFILNPMPPATTLDISSLTVEQLIKELLARGAKTITF